MSIPELRSFVGCRFTVSVILLGLLGLMGAFLLPACPVLAATIVLDPGHGGHDGGAGGNSAYAEKRFTLELARRVAEHLAANHRVELTRTADISVSPEDRAGTANHLKADLMVSLHAAVSPYCGDRNAFIYYHDDERLVFPSESAIQRPLTDTETGRPEWNRLQIRHQAQSRRLAAAMKLSLQLKSGFDTIMVTGVPLIALMGADLPAVLMEVGCIHPTVPLTGQQFQRQLDDLAQPIATAIESAIDELNQ